MHEFQVSMGYIIAALALFFLIFALPSEWVANMPLALKKAGGWIRASLKRGGGGMFKI